MKGIAKNGKQWVAYLQAGSFALDETDDHEDGYHGDGGKHEEPGDDQHPRRGRGLLAQHVYHQRNVADHIQDEDCLQQIGLRLS